MKYVFTPGDRYKVVNEQRLKELGDGSLLGQIVTISADQNIYCATAWIKRGESAIAVKLELGNRWCLPDTCLEPTTERKTLM